MWRIRAARWVPWHATRLGRLIRPATAGIHSGFKFMPLLVRLQPLRLRVSSTAQAMGSGLEVDPPALGSLTTQAGFAPGTLFIYLIGDY